MTIERRDIQALREHELKCWPEYFEAVTDGRKTFELRKDDRGFALGDTLRLREYDPLTGNYSGREHRARVSYLLRGGAMTMSSAIAPGYVILGLDALSGVETPQEDGCRACKDGECPLHLGTPSHLGDFTPRDTAPSETPTDGYCHACELLCHAVDGRRCGRCGSAQIRKLTAAERERLAEPPQEREKGWQFTRADYLQAAEDAFKALPPTYQTDIDVCAMLRDAAQHAPAESHPGS